MPQIIPFVVTAIVSVTSAVVAAGPLAVAAFNAANIIGAAALANEAFKAVQPSVKSSSTAIEWAADPNAPNRFAFGRVGGAGNIIHNATYGPDSMYVGFVGVMSASGPIKGWVGFRAEETPVTFDGSGKANSSYYANVMWLDRLNGTQPASRALASPAGLKGGASMPSWGANAKLSGKAAYMYTLAENSKQTAYKGKVPTGIHTIEGLYCYDPRFDSTYPGGSGSCRLNDPTTWVYSENAYIHALNWDIGRWEGLTAGAAGAPYASQKVGGIGARPEGIDFAGYVEGANVFDENGWKCAAWPDADQGKAAVLDSFLQAGGGIYAERQGRISCMHRAAPRTSIATITTDDTAGTIEYDTTTSLLDRINTIRPEFWSEANNWQMVATDEVTSSVWRLEDGQGVALTKSRGMQYNYVPGSKQARELACLQIAHTREGIRGTAPLRHYLDLEVGDCIDFEVPEAVLNGQKVIILNVDPDLENDIINVTFASETDAKYPFAFGQTAAPPPAPSIVPGDPTVISGPLPGDWTVTPRPPATGGTQLPGFDLTGLVSNATATAMLVEYGPDPAGPWKQAYQGPPTVTNVPIDGVQPGAIYYIAISYQRGQNFSQREVYGPYTAPGLVAGDVLPTSPTIVDINARYDDLIDAYGDTVAAEASASAAAASAAAAAADRAAADLALGGAEASELAAAGSASVASSKADEAAGSAEASSASATAAQASNSASGGSASASAASAATASAKATEAGTSAAAAQADRIGAQTANSNVGIARDGAVAAQSGAAGSQAAAAQSATLAARVGIGGSMFANAAPSFALGRETTSIPVGWTDWASGWENTQVSGQASDKAIRYVVPANADRGISANTSNAGQFIGAAGPGWWVLQFLVTLESGSLLGSGGLLQTLSGGVEVPSQGSTSLNFASDADDSGIVRGAGSAGKTYSFAKLIKVGESINQFVLYAMPAWGGFGERPAKTIIYHLAGVRRATAGEVENGIARGVYASVSARISAEEAVRASETAALASRASATEAVARTGANLVVNSSALQGMRGWYPSGPVTIGADPASDDGPRFITFVPAGTSVDFRIGSDFFVAYGGNQYSLQGEIYRQGQTTGEARFYVEWLTAGNVTTGYQVLTSYVDVYWQRFTAQGFVAPPNTAKGRIYCDCIFPTFPGNGTIGFRRIKLESGALCTGWTDEAAAASLSARTSITETSVADAQSKLAVARLVLLAEATGGRPARFGLQSDSFGGSFASIDAAKIYFGDNTVFDDVSDTLQTVTGSIRRVIAWGSTFGPDSLFEWVGDSSVALSAMNRANAQFFMASTSPYIGGAAITPAVETGFVLAGSASPLQTAVGATSVTVSAAVTGATGTVFYRWSQTGGDAATISNANIVNPTISVADNTGKVVQLQCQISDDQKTRTKYLRVFFRSNV